MAKHRRQKCLAFVLPNRALQWRADFFVNYYKGGGYNRLELACVLPLSYHCPTIVLPLSYHCPTIVLSASSGSVILPHNTLIDEKVGTPLQRAVG